MAPKSLHIIGIDPGGTTGWVLITIPRECMFGKKPEFFGSEASQILEWDYGEFCGDENIQVDKIRDLALSVQGLSYKVGPAMVIEDFRMESPNSDPEVLSPVRIAAKLSYAQYLGRLGDSRLMLQNRGLAFGTATDARLRAWGLWVEGSDHVRAATRHAIVALRRARGSLEFRDQLWDARECSL